MKTKYITANVVNKQLKLNATDFKIKYFNKLVTDQIKIVRYSLTDKFEIKLPYSVYGDKYTDVEFVQELGYIIILADNNNRTWLIRLKPE